MYSFKLRRGSAAGREEGQTRQESFKHDPDGSLTLYFQNESPGKDKEANWLPAPKGPFNLTMRLYAPKSDALTGKWDPPPITRMQPLPGLVVQ